MREQKFIIKSNNKIATNIYEMILSGDVSESIHGGNFLNISIPSSPQLILKRPFGISKYTKDTLTFCYQVVGKGTESLKAAICGQEVMVTYPLGNYFDGSVYNNILLVGGGVGVFPLLQVASDYPKKCHALLGYKSKEYIVYKDEFARLCKTCEIATDDGSVGKKAFVTNCICGAIESKSIDAILICGPHAMIQSCKSILPSYTHIPCFVSVEQRMGCGIGACLVCTCRVKHGDEWEHKRVCADGPVFNIWEVE